MTHLIPINDIDKHELSASCKCRPEVTGSLVSHNSFDNREADEDDNGFAADGKHWTLIEEAQ